MRLTKQTDHAIRILMYCAVHGGLSRVGDIATTYGLSKLFLFKILRPLNKAGLIETVRGRNGGVRLARAAKALTLFDIVTATEGSFSMTDCFQDRSARCQLLDACGLNTVLRSALHAFFEVLSDYTIEDLVTAGPKTSFFLDLDTVLISPLAVRSGPAPCL